MLRDQYHIKGAVYKGLHVPKPSVVMYDTATYGLLHSSTPKVNLSALTYRTCLMHK